jgi:hypothetical protein
VRIGPSSANNRFPLPTITGSIVRRISSTRSRANSSCASRGLPNRSKSPPDCALRASTARAASPESSVAFFQASGSPSVVLTTYFGRVFRGSDTARSDSGACGQKAAKFS